MIMKITRHLLLTGCLLFFAGVTHAYSTFLTVTNNQNWTQGQNFAEVTIDGIDVGGGDFDYMFTVNLCGDPTAITCTGGQQIEQFGFNLFGSVALNATTNFVLPTTGTGANTDWFANVGGGGNTMDGFGTFDVTVNMGGGGGAIGEQPLIFTITGVAGDSIATYATALSSQNDLFSAKVSSTGPGAFIGGGSPVPVPAAVWLFGSGLLGLLGIARKKTT